MSIGTPESEPAIPQPPPTAKKLVRYILGFGVSVAIGLAPYLGKVKVPLFDSLLTIIPESIQNTILPLSAALMGVVAVGIQWYAGEKTSARRLRTFFKRTMILTITSLFILIIVHSLVVVTVPILGGKDAVSFIVGFQRPQRAPCTELSDKECIKKLTFDTSKIESFWGDSQVRLARLSLMTPYLLFTTSFGLIVGLVVLKERGQP